MADFPTSVTCRCCGAHDPEPVDADVCRTCKIASCERCRDELYRCIRCQRPVEVPSDNKAAPCASYCEPCGKELYGAWRYVNDD